MIFRLKLLIPFLLVLIAIYFAFTSISEPLVKNLLENNLTGLKLKSFRIDSNSDNLQFLTQATYGDEAGPLVVIDRAEINIESYPIGFGEIVARGNLENVRVSSRIFGSSEKSASSSNIDSTDEKGGFSLGSIDHREILERFTGQRELETELKIKQAQVVVEDLKDKWTKRYTELSTQADILKGKGEDWQKNWKQQFNVKGYETQVKDLKAELETLKGQKFDMNNIQGLTENLQKIQSLSDKLGTLKTDLKNLQTQGQQELGALKGIKTSFEQLKNSDDEVAQDLKQLNGLKGEILVSGKSDIQMLKKELDPREFDADKITRLLLGREWELKLKFYLDALDTILAKVDSASGNSTSASNTIGTSTQDSSAPSKWVTYLRENDRPSWSIAKLRYAGTAAQAMDGADVAFEGFMENITSDEALWGKTPGLTLRGKLPGRGGNFECVGLYSSIHRNSDFRNLKFELKGRSLEGMSMGAPNMRILFDKGSMASHSTIDLSSAPNWIVKGQVLLSDFNFQVAESVQMQVREPLKESATRLFSKPLGFTYRYPGPLRFDSEVGEVMGSVMKGALSSMAVQEQGLLEQKLQQRFEEKIASKLGGSSTETLLNDQFPALQKSLSLGLQQITGLQQSGEADVGKAQQQQGLVEQMLADALGVKGGQGALKEQLEQKVKDEATRRLQAEAQKQVQNKLLNQLGGAKPAETNEPKKDAPKEEPKIENIKGVDDIKKAFKGLGF
jgi:hypothetical protein